MGANTFQEIGTGATADKAFWAAVEHSLYMNGHGGYSGTLAEKHEFVLMGEAENTELAHLMASAFINNDDERILDKWGPAGCIRILGTNKYVFFGWASS